MIDKMDMNTRRIRLVIFDLDGTLIDSLEDIADAANDALAEAGLPPHPAEAYRFFVGDGLAVLVNRIVPSHTSVREKERLAKRFKALYQQNWKNKTHLYAGIRELVDWLIENGLSIHILSNKPDVFTRMCVENFFPDMPFGYVYGQREHVPLKPHPQAALEIIDRAGASIQSSLFVGDTAVDMKTGKNAGMQAVGVTWGFRQKEELLAAGADAIISTPEAFKSYVCNPG